MPFATDDLLARVITPCFGMRRLDRWLSITPAEGDCSRPCRSRSSISSIVDRLEQESARQLEEPAINSLPRAEMDRQYPPVMSDGYRFVFFAILAGPGSALSTSRLESHLSRSGIPIAEFPNSL
jgi:hypothetical protein